MSENDNGGKKAERRFSQEQYEMLLRCSEKKDISEWNEWREDHPDEPFLLEGAELSGAHLNGVDLSEAYLNGANPSSGGTFVQRVRDRVVKLFCTRSERPRSRPCLL